MKVYCFNPRDNSLTTITRQDAERFTKKRKAALAKYLTAQSVGILISTKNGQFYLDKARRLIKIEKQKNPDKQLYLFTSNTIDYNQLQNFPFIEAWVNTACPRIVDEKADMVNVDAIFEVYGLEVKESLVV